MFRKIALAAFAAAALSAPAAAVTILLGQGPLGPLAVDIVPEPQNLALLLAGFGMVGLSVRRRPTATV